VDIKQIAAVTTGLFGIYLIVNVLLFWDRWILMSVATVLGAARFGPDGPFGWYSVALGLFGLAVSLLPGVLLIVFRRQITRKWLLWCDTQDDQPVSPINIGGLVVGLFGLTLVVRSIYLIARSIDQAIGSQGAYPGSILGLVPPTAYGLIGILLILFPRKVASWLS